MKKIIAFILPIVLIVGAVTSYIFVFNPVSSIGFVSVDINPSIQLITDENDNVIGFSAGNDDGELLLMDETLDLMGKKVETAVENIVKATIKYGFLDPDALATDPNAVSISTMLENGNVNQENRLRNKIKTGVEEYFKNNGIYGMVLTDIDMNDVVTEAVELGISAGKLKLIKSVQAVNEEFTLEQGINAEVKDMIQMLRFGIGIEDKVLSKIDYVQDLITDIATTNATLLEANASLVIKQAELNILNLVDIELLDETALAEHNSAIELLEEQIAELNDYIITLNADLVDLNADLLEAQGELTAMQTKLQDMQADKLQKLNQAQTKYQNWLENKTERANQVRNSWESFEEGLTENQRQAIFDYFDDYFSQTESEDVGEIPAS